MSENKVITVLVVDDSAVMRLGLRTLLDQDDGIEVVGEAENGQCAAPPSFILMSFCSTSGCLGRTDCQCCLSSLRGQRSS